MMRCTALRLLKLLSPAVSVVWVATGLAQSQPASPPAAPCSNVTNLGYQPLSTLPRSIQAQIRQAVRPAVLAIINDPGMGMADTKWNDIPLEAIKITQLAESGGLYVISWGDSSFGVNEAIWIVELERTGARNLLDSQTSRSSRSFVSGFGIEVLSQTTGQYPEIMVASKGFGPGGAEAEATCLHKVGDFYEPLACPAECHQNLNAR